MGGTVADLGCQLSKLPVYAVQGPHHISLRLQLHRALHHWNWKLHHTKSKDAIAHFGGIS